MSIGLCKNCFTDGGKLELEYQPQLTMQKLFELMLSYKAVELDLVAGG
jgi:hypothetical protein